MYKLEDIITLVAVGTLFIVYILVTFGCDCCSHKKLKKVKRVKKVKEDTKQEEDTKDTKDEESLESFTKQKEEKSLEEEECISEWYSYSYLTDSSDTSSKEDQMIKCVAPPEPSEYIEEENKDTKEKEEKGLEKEEEKDKFPWLTAGGSLSMFV